MTHKESLKLEEAIRPAGKWRLRTPVEDALMEIRYASEAAHINWGNGDRAEALLTADAILIHCAALYQAIEKIRTSMEKDDGKPK